MKSDKKAGRSFRDANYYKMQFLRTADNKFRRAKKRRVRAEFWKVMKEKEKVNEN